MLEFRDQGREDSSNLASLPFAFFGVEEFGSALLSPFEQLLNFHYVPMQFKSRGIFLNQPNPKGAIPRGIIQIVGVCGESMSTLLIGAGR